VNTHIVAAVVVGVLALCGSQASARPGVTAGPSAAVAPSPDRIDDSIRRVFRDVLDRQPNNSELRRYRTLMEEDGWTENDVRSDLRTRDDYRRHSGRGGNEVDRIIRRAYQDILNREPDREGLAGYREAMVEKGWTENDVRDALRKSPEYARQQRQSSERIVRRAYQDLLGREPDAGGLATYTARVMRDGWDEQDVRAALRKSPEFRDRNAMTREKAEQIVRAAYRAVLKRDADDSGLRTYVQKVMRDRWSQAQVEQELRMSDEYRKMNRK
jgi:TorA maturation chaperone TorD